jgi:hypothetical protein
MQSGSGCSSSAAVYFSMEPFLRDFLYILTYGKIKYKDITRNIEGIYKKMPNEICKVLSAVIDGIP